MTLDIFLLALLVVSTFTGLFTEAIKKILTERNKKYYSNTLAGIVASVLSVIIGIGYVVITGVGFTAPVIAYLLALVLLSWLCAMIGYDKVMQAITQFKGKTDIK